MNTIFVLLVLIFAAVHASYIPMQHQVEMKTEPKLMTFGKMKTFEKPSFSRETKESTEELDLQLKTLMVILLRNKKTLYENCFFQINNLLNRLNIVSFRPYRPYGNLRNVMRIPETQTEDFKECFFFCK